MAEKNVWIVIPAFNEEATIKQVIKSLKKHGWRNIIVVDDGSVDNTPSIAEREDVIVLKHIINRGLGAALGTGIKAALDLGADIIVTFDADLQHKPEDVERLIKPIIQGRADVVIGSRFLNKEYLKGMPLSKKIGNIGLNIITYLLFGAKTSDSQSGMRAFSRKAAQTISIKTNRMEVSSEIIAEVARKKLKKAEIPIKAIYLRKGQSVWDGFKILGKLILKRLME
ncbi:glycosyltransferase family 2 protein [Candidatus Woesearchaeota archaeon]|nr:glycosyltransferase family 2 protein [Candidatus Woesearchaeota archaeon]